MNVGSASFVPGSAGATVFVPGAPAFVPAGRSGLASSVPSFTPSAAPFVPASAVEAAPAGVAFLRGAVKGGVPVPERGPPKDVSLPEELYASETAPRLAPPQPRPVMGPDGVPVFLQRGHSARDAVGPLGDSFSALPPPRGAPSRSHTAGCAPHESLFSGEALRAELARQRLLVAATPLPGSEEAERVPQLLHRFHSLMPLEEAEEEEAQSAALGGLRSACFKALNGESGQALLLRRLCPSSAPPSQQAVAAASELVARWAPLAGHPGLCALRLGFAAEADEWGPLPFLLTAHDFHPGAIPLSRLHCSPGGAPANPEQLWQLATQLAAVLQAIHGAGLAARAPCLAPSKVLLCAGGRLRLACPGLPCLLAGEGLGGVAPPRGDALARLQRADLAALGRLLLQVGCCPAGPPWGGSLALLQRRGCPPRLLQLVGGLLDAGSAQPGPGSLRDVGALAAQLGEASLASLSRSLAAQDSLLAECARDAEAGRMLRTLLKLGFVLEKPGVAADETGDGYLLHLFRDWLFHQPRHDGAPRLDWGLVYEALGKLDVGAPERILLLSRDEGSMLVASFADIKRCAEQAYAQLEQQQQTADELARSLAFGEAN